MFCVKCGAAVPEGGQFCASCGAPVSETTVDPALASGQSPRGSAPSFAAAASPRLTAWPPTPTYGSPRRWNGEPLAPDFAGRKVAAGICGILFGSLGIHKFILGYVGPGLIMLLVTLISIPLCLVLIGYLGLMATSIIGFVEGILYLTKSDQEFVVTYGVNKRAWF
jgi:TM2 domain-containing membrane protein YozV